MPFTPSSPCLPILQPVNHASLIPILRSAYTAVSDAVLVVLPSATQYDKRAMDATILLANSSAIDLLGFNVSDALQRAIEGISIRSVLYEMPAVETTAHRYPPVDITSIVSKFDDFNARSVPDAMQTVKVKLRAKPAAGKSFPVDVTISQLALDALVGGDEERRRCPLVLTLKRSSIQSLAVPVDSKRNPSPELQQQPCGTYSRYKAEFEELSCLGKGGFGIVFRARNRLDGIEYAIKKVKLSCTPVQFSLFASAPDTVSSGSVKSSFTAPSSLLSTTPGSVSMHDARLLNEIKLFARLSQHPNVVSYHTAWIESEPEKPVSPKQKEPPVSAAFITPKNKIPSLSLNVNGASGPPSVTSQLSASLKSANLDGTAPSRPSPQQEYILFRPPSQLSMNASISNASSFGRRQFSTSNDEVDMIEFTTSGSSRSSKASSHQSETSDDSESEDSDGEDLKRFMWRGGKASAVNIKTDRGLPSRGSGKLSASLPIHFGRSSRLLSSETATGESDAETFKVSRLSNFGRLGSELSLISGVSRLSSVISEKSSDSEEENESDLITESSVENPGGTKQHQATLYIQMQLCPYMDLRTFINKRRSNPSMTSKSSIRPSIPVKNQYSHMFLVDDLEGPKLFEDYDDTEEENNPTRTINLYLFKQIVEGLMHIHEQHVVHRDIKPDNIFVQENYNVLVGDFGLAKSLASHAVNNLADSPEPETDETGTASTDEGTFFYMAPELLDQHIYTAKSDIYSLGIILLELFHPFSTEMERIMLLTELKKNPLSLAHFCSASGMPSDVSHLLSRLLSVDPSKRPSAMEIILDPLFDNFASQQLGIRSPLATSPNHSVSLNTNSFLSMRRPSSSFTLRPGSMRSDHLHLRQRASSTTITGNFAHRSSSGSPSDPIGSGVASFIGPRSLPSYKFPAHTTEDDDESSMSTSSKPPYVPHPRSSSFDLSNGNDTVELIGLGESIHEGMEKKEEAPKQTNAFAQLWGMIKNVTKPKSGSSNEGLGSAGLVESPVPEDAIDPAPSQQPHMIRHSDSIRSLSSVLSQKTMEKYGGVALGADSGLVKLQALKHKSSQMDSRRQISDGFSLSTASTMIGSSPTTSLVQTSCIRPKATCDRMLSAPAPFSDTVNETEGKDTRIMELENDVSLLLEQLLALKKKNLEMEAKLASKEEGVGSAEEKD